MREDLKKGNLIVQLSFEFAVEVVAFCEILDNARKWSLANQILRASFSIGANVKKRRMLKAKPTLFIK